MANNVTIPAAGTGDTTPVVEALDTTGTSGPKRQIVGLGSIGAPASSTSLTAGQKTSAASIPVVLASDQSQLPAALTAGAGSLKTGMVFANPSSVLTRPADTTAYSANDLVASSTIAGSVTVPSFTATPNTGGSGSITKLRLYTNRITGMAGVQLLIELWVAAPTFNNGDNGAYSVHTGAASFLGRFTVTSMVQVDDGAYGVALPDLGNAVDFVLASSPSVFWTLETLSAFTPASAQTFTLVPEIRQN